MLPEEIVSAELIEKGWSVDRKYCLTLKNAEKRLLRITPHDKKKDRKQLFLMMQKVADLGVPTCKALELGECEQGTYLIYEWIDGEDAETVVPYLPKQEQYRLGVQSGKILKKIHSVPAPESTEEWSARFSKKADRNIRLYRECPLSFDGAEEIINYLNQNRSLLKNRPQCFHHGDYHIGNMMIANGGLVVIDFDRFDFGDPWEEFNRIVWCAQKVPIFGAGMIDGYFDCSVPQEFWKTLAFYIGSNMLSSLPWAVPFGEKQIEVMLRQAKEVMGWYQNFTTVFPSWYRQSKQEIWEKI